MAVIQPLRVSFRDTPCLLAVAAIASIALAFRVANARARRQGGTCESFKVVVNGQTFSGTKMRTINGPINSIFVDGTYIEFRVNRRHARRPTMSTPASPAPVPTRTFPSPAARRSSPARSRSTARR
jgi:hypothetical protein